MDSKKIIAVAAVAIIAIAACTVVFMNGDDNDSVAMKDAAGNVIEIPDEVKTITGCSPSIVDTLCYMGYGSKLVCVSNYCTNPLVPSGTPQCGSYSNPDSDAISTANADVTFLDNSGSGAKAVYETLKASGMNVILTFGSDDGLDGIYKNIEIFGQIFGDESKADDLVKDLKSEIKYLGEKTDGADVTEVIITTGLGNVWSADSDGNFVNLGAFDGSGVYVAGSGSTASQFIGNVSEMKNPIEGSSWVPADTDYISTKTADVDVIMVTWGGTTPNADAKDKLIEQMKTTAWANCGAVQEGNIVFVCGKTNSDISRLTPYTVFDALPIMSLYMNPECYKATAGGEALSLDDLPFYIDDSNYEMLKGYTEN